MVSSKFSSARDAEEDFRKGGKMAEIRIHKKISWVATAAYFGSIGGVAFMRPLILVATTVVVAAYGALLLKAIKQGK